MVKSNYFVRSAEDDLKQARMNYEAAVEDYEGYKRGIASAKRQLTLPHISDTDRAFNQGYLDQLDNESTRQNHETRIEQRKAALEAAEKALEQALVEHPVEVS